MSYMQECSLVACGLVIFFVYCDMTEPTDITKLLLCPLSISFLSNIVKLCSWSFLGSFSISECAYIYNFQELLIVSICC